MGTGESRGQGGCMVCGRVSHCASHRALSVCLTKGGCGLKLGAEGRVECLWERMLD